MNTTPVLESDPGTELWAASALANKTTKITMRDDITVALIKEDGELWRNAFRIHIAPEHHNYFSIVMFHGSTSGDLRLAERIVEDAKNDKFWPGTWEARNYTDGCSGWSVIRKFFRDDRHLGDRSPLRACHEERCRKALHEYLGGERAEACVADEICTDDYTIRLQNWHEGEGWQPDATLKAEDLVNANHLRMLDRFRNDFAYLLGEAEKLNAAAPRAVVA